MAFGLVIAGKGGKRSRAAREVAEALATRGLHVGGFTQRTLEREAGPKAIELVRIRDGRTVSLARTAADDGTTADPAACTLAFEHAAFEEARRWIEKEAPDADVIVLDGLGKLELGGGGHRAAIALALATAPVVVLAVRDDQLVYVFEAFGLDEPVAAYTDGSGAAALEAFVEEIARTARA